MTYPLAMAERTRSDRPGRPPAKAAAPSGPVERRSNRRRGPTPKGGRSDQAAANKRYTAPIPKETRHSPKWYPWLLLTLLFLGVVVIILNYVQALPSSPSDWYTIGGVVALLAGALLATGYR